jgi:hypothetical protein
VPVTGVSDERSASIFRIKQPLNIKQFDYVMAMHGRKLTAKHDVDELNPQKAVIKSDYWAHSGAADSNLRGSGTVSLSE